MKATRTGNRIRGWWLAMVILLGGCATKPGPATAYLYYHRPPAAELRQQLGVVEVVAASEPIVIKTQRPQGLHENIRDAAATVAKVVDDHGPGQIRHNVEKVEAWALTLPGLSALAEARGRMRTGPPPTIRDSRQALTRAVLEMDLQQEWARQVYDTGRRDVPEVKWQWNDSTGARSYLELRVAALSLVGAQAANPPLYLRLVIEARLRRVGEEKALYECEFEYTGAQGYRLADWGREDAQMLRKEIPRVLPKISGRVVNILFQEEPDTLENLYSEIPD